MVSLLSAYILIKLMASLATDSKNGKKRKASEMEDGETPTAAKKRAKPTPRVTKGRVKGQ
jgi:hypothetical protein